MNLSNAIRAGVLSGCTLLASAGAIAIDLTGIWEGDQKCERYDGKKFQADYKNDFMLITQDGANIYMAALFFDDEFFLINQGTVIPDAKDPATKAQAGFTNCMTAPGSPYQETGRMTRVELKKGKDAELEATSQFLQLAGDGFPTDVGTCTWKYKRISTQNTEVPSCADFPSPTSSSSVRISPNARHPRP